MLTMIYMVRHAESPYTAGEERTRGLSPDGVLKSRQVTELLQDEGIDMIVSSPYARAMLTVEGLAGKLNLPIETYEDLRERQFADDSYLIRDEQFMTQVQNMFSDPEYALPGGESSRVCQQRAVPVLFDLLEQHRGKKIVIGTHGNVMTLMMNYFDSSYGWDFFIETKKPDIYKMEFQGTRLAHVMRLWKD
ncbi:histidine phosphatase family protein [Paenibacillus motobuensis]|uniref:Histidine phosphatase family protein n=1 Tax=Paenibacillus motobuensis TaxID=295324 RepID=A0ABN0YGR9_9BACL